MPLDRVARGNEFIKKYKLFTAKAAEDGKLPGKVIGNITRGLPNMICSGTYLMIGPFDNEVPMLNCESYMKTKFFRALVAINKISQNASYKVYDAVPMQDFSKPWTDEELYKKYNLTQEEIDFIESMIRPME
jgi:site-specific DNA-methyltransferase (adenine-specific)